MKKSEPRVEMICSVEELANLFKQGQDIRGFLNQVVNIVIKHMDAGACSIYLFNEEKNHLVLQATTGLNPQLIGKLTLSPEEGLVGLALRKLRPIREDRGQENPRFKLIKSSDEEHFSSFLAVPITHGTQRVGVLVLQDEKESRFSEKDTSALQAIASQLASTLENVQLIIEKPGRDLLSESRDGPPIRLIRGTPVVEGVAWGRAYPIESPGMASHLLIAGDDGYCETMAGLELAITKTEEQIETLQKQLEEELADVASLIFSAHLLMLRDDSFSGSMKNLVKAGKQPSDAVVQVVNEYSTIFSYSDNPRMREKVLDTKDLGHRILKNLIQSNDIDGDYSGQIVISSEILPSELLKLATQNVEAIVLYGGGLTAHITVLAASLQVPLLYTEDKTVARITPNMNLALDAIQGNLFVNPEESILRRIMLLKKSTDQLHECEADVKEESYTADGVRIYLRAAINLLSDIKIAQRLCCEGIGLYRSEFPFLIRNDFPSEEEQFHVYSQVVGATGDFPVTLRTLDVGGDKTLSYLQDEDESNPFLGLRGIRFLLKNIPVFKVQAKAMIRAGGFRKNMRMLFPLISSLDDFRNARDVVKTCLGELEQEGLGTYPMPHLGAMIELPSAVLLAKELSYEADFLSIGTNDLIQYMLGVDRTNEKVAELFDSCHPAVLRAIKIVADAARERSCPLSICGNMASNPKAVYYMIGLGITDFTMAPGKSPELQKQIAKMNANEAIIDAQHICSLGTPAEIRSFLSHL